MKVIKIRKSDESTYSKYLQKARKSFDECEKTLIAMNVTPALNNMDWNDVNTMISILGGCTRLQRILDKMLSKVQSRLEKEKQK